MRYQTVVLNRILRILHCFDLLNDSIDVLDVGRFDVQLFRVLDVALAIYAMPSEFCSQAISAKRTAAQTVRRTVDLRRLELPSRYLRPLSSSVVNATS